ncbi:Palmitoyltransferase AKR1 [Diplonema papillatum]|nr:Palmitoyltransferase AKR1 [Diplonema papillatum]
MVRGPASARKGIRLDVAQYRYDPRAELPSAMQCAEHGVLELIAARIMLRPENVTPKDIVSEPETGGRHGTALHHAALQGNVEVIDFLLEHDADPNCKTVPEGETPLMWAAADPAPKIPLLRRLIAKGADPTIRDAKGATAFTHALVQPINAHFIHVRGGPVQVTDVHYAVRNGLPRGLLYLLETHGHVVDLEARDEDGLTPLALACRAMGAKKISRADQDSQQQVLKTLLSFRASPAALAPAEVPKAARGIVQHAQRQGPNFTFAPLYGVSNANAHNLISPTRLFRMLAAGVLPNAALVVAALYLPAVFGFVVMVLNLWGVQKATKTVAKAKRPEGTLAGWYSGALVFGSVILVTQVFPSLPAEQDPWVHLWWVVTGLMFACYLRTVLSDPGVVVASRSDRAATYKLIEQGIDPVAADHCHSTLCRKPLRSKFCTTSKRLVHRFDHYCVWTSNTIGAGNHRGFYLFTVFQSISQCLVLKFALAHLKLGSLPSWAPCAVLDHLFSDKNTIVAYFLFLYNAAVMVFIGAVLVTQTWFLNRNVTSNDVWFPDRYPWLFVVGSRVFSLYDRGVWENWKQFFFGDLKGSGYVVPSFDQNPYLTKKFKLNAMGMVEPKGGGACAKGCCEQPHAGGAEYPTEVVAHSPPVGDFKVSSGAGHVVTGYDPIPAPAAPPAPPAPASSSSPSSRQQQPPQQQQQQVLHKPVPPGKSNLVDPETGFVFPSQLQEQILKLPVATRMIMAAKQQAEFKKFNIMDSAGNMRLPDKGSQAQFLEQTKQAQMMQYTPATSSAESARKAKEPERPQENISPTAVIRGSAGLRSVSTAGKRSVAE